VALRIEGRHIWDFWYIYENKLFTVYFLNCDAQYHLNGEQHHRSVIGAAKTLDFVDFFDVNLDVFHASEDSWDNTSIWTGDTVCIYGRKYLFYPSRDKHEADGTIQHIGVAEWHDDSWKRLDTKISAPSGWYLSSTDPEESSIHCWRDPFVFFRDGHIYMLVAAKRKTAPANHRGCVALLEVDEHISSFRHVRVLLETEYSELELPQIYESSRGGMRVLCNARTSDGGTQFAMTQEFFNITGDDVHIEKELGHDIYERDKYYGFRVVPECHSIIGAFHEQQGFVQVFSNMRSLGWGVDRLKSMKLDDMHRCKCVCSRD